MEKFPSAERLLEDIVWAQIAALGLAIGALYGAALPELLKQPQFFLVSHFLAVAILLGGLAANIATGNKENPYAAYGGFLLGCALLGGLGSWLFGLQVAGNLLPLAILLSLISSLILACALLIVAQTLVARLANKFR